MAKLPRHNVRFARFDAATNLFLSRELESVDKQAYEELNAGVLEYGFVHPSQLTGVTATGTTSADAYVIPQQRFVRVDTTPSGTGVRASARRMLRISRSVSSILNIWSYLQYKTPIYSTICAACGLFAGACPRENFFRCTATLLF
mgnify:CR=1 FL=1